MPKQTSQYGDYPQAVISQIRLLAQNILIARKRRNETQAQWAKKLGVSQPTMARIERGDPSVAMVSYVMCMWLINQATGLPELISPLNDHASLEREITKARARRPSSVPAAMPTTPNAGAAATTPAQARGKAASTDNSAAAAGLAALLSEAKRPAQ
jgi:transcriptional regulator with XRE-family HTH domain